MIYTFKLYILLTLTIFHLNFYLTKNFAFLKQTPKPRFINI